MTSSTTLPSAPYRHPEWQCRQHDKRPTNHMMRGRDWKWGQAMEKYSYRLDYVQLQACRDIADERDTTLSTVLVEAIEAGGAGWIQPDANVHLLSQLAELERRRDAMIEDLDASDSELLEQRRRMQRFLRRERATLPLLKQLLKNALSSNERHELDLVLEAEKKRMHAAAIAAVPVEVHVAAAVPVMAGEVREDPADVLFGIRLPISVAAALQARADELNVSRTDVLEACVHRYLQIQGRDPSTDQILAALMGVRVHMVSLRAAIRLNKRRSRELIIKRETRSKRLRYALERGRRGRRQFTKGEIWAVQAMDADPDCLVDDEQLLVDDMHVDVEAFLAS